jgi:hypothetical protein
MLVSLLGDFLLYPLGQSPTQASSLYMGYNLSLIAVFTVYSFAFNGIVIHQVHVLCSAALAISTTSSMVTSIDVMPVMEAEVREAATAVCALLRGQWIGRSSRAEL